MFAKGGDFGKPLSTGERINFGVFQSSLILYVSAVAFSIFGRSAMNGVRNRITQETHRNVFWGLSKRDLLLANSIVGEDPWQRVQFNLPKDYCTYDASEKSRMTDLADKAGAFWLEVDFKEPGETCHQGWRHFFLGDDGHANLALANRVVDAVKADDKCCTEKTLYVRVGDIDHEEIFAHWAKRVYEETAHLVRPVIVREQEMVARKYVEKFHPLAALGIDKDHVIDTRSATVRDKGHCRTLLMGFDHTGRALLNTRLALSRFVGSDGKSTIAFPITVVDMKPERWTRYCLAYPEIGERKQDYGLEFLPMQVGYGPFENWLRQNHAEFDRFVFCLPDDGVNIREALRVRDILIEMCDTERKELLVKVSDPSVNEFIAADDEYEKEHGFILPLKCFGDASELYSVAFMDGDPVDKIARALNWQWNVGCSGWGMEKLPEDKDYRKSIEKELDDDVKRFWQKASYYDRLSSRASAMGGLSFFKLLGLDLKLKSSVVEGEHVVENKDVLKRVRAVEDVLARTEHLRWCTYLRTLGMREWNLKTPLALDVIVKENRGKRIVPNKLAKQTDRFRAHAALVEYDDLPRVDVELARAMNIEHEEKDFVGLTRPDRCGTSLQGKDYDIWRIFPSAAEQAGFTFVEVEKRDDLKKGSV